MEMPNNANDPARLPQRNLLPEITVTGTTRFTDFNAEKSQYVFLLEHRAEYYEAETKRWYHYAPDRFEVVASGKLALKAFARDKEIDRARVIVVGRVEYEEGHPVLHASSIALAL